jgi:hypothetical protein
VTREIIIIIIIIEEEEEEDVGTEQKFCQNLMYGKITSTKFP